MTATETTRAEATPERRVLDAAEGLAQWVVDRRLEAPQDADIADVSVVGLVAAVSDWLWLVGGSLEILRAAGVKSGEEPDIVLLPQVEAILSAARMVTS